MSLCSICATLDLRSLFQLYIDQDGRDTSLPYPHSIFSIRQASQQGCTLCSFIWSEFMKQRIEERSLWYYCGPKGEITDEELASRYKALSWSSSGCNGQLRIWSPERDGDLISNTVANLVVCPLAENPPMVNETMKALLSEEIVSYSGSDRALATAAGWLKQCRNEHEHCSWAKLLPRFLPTRVIAVGSGTDALRLHTPTEGELGSWTALSYCWGGASDFVLTAATRSKFEQGVDLSAFPATLRDAITVTRALGIRYIWIDALCILQDSAADWNREAPKMGQIYTNAEVVIAATNSANVNAGIFESRPRPKTIDMPWTLQDDSLKSDAKLVHLHHLTADPLADVYQEDPRWSTRGWTMQEDFLATRLLMFTDKKTHWECLTTKIDESGLQSQSSYVFAENRDYCSRYITRVISSQLSQQPLSASSTDPKYPEYDKDLYDMWYILVKAYSQRNLTQAKDRLPALSGLAMTFEGILKDEYFAGLWKGDLVSGLTWSHGTWGYAGDDNLKEAHGPSWSWTSLEGKLDDFVSKKPLDVDDDILETVTRVIDVKVDLVSPSKFGGVENGRIEIEAPFVRWRPESGDIPEGTSNLAKFIAERISDPKYAVNAEFKLRHKPYEGQSFIALHLFTTAGRKAQILLLETVEGSMRVGPQCLEGNEEQRLYVRVGKLQARARSKTGVYKDPDEMSYISETEHGAFGECNAVMRPSQFSYVMPQAEKRESLPVQRFMII